MTRLLIEPQRSALVSEFIQAMGATNHNRFGVLISGPAGAGKTAVGLVSFAYCVARRHPCVYIPDAGDWVQAAEAGQGDEFFLGVLLRQNADLILADTTLFDVLGPALSGGPLDAAVMTALLDALRSRPGPPVGCIVDEVQKISAAVAAAKEPGAIAEKQKAALYFKQWQSWATRYQVFVRMDIASANGSREFTLPAGESSRLRIMRPWPIEEVDAFCGSVASPLYMTKIEIARAFFVGGGILRLLYQIKSDLGSGGNHMAMIEDNTRAAMLEHCQKWFDNLSDLEREQASDSMLALIRGEVRWNRVKGLYDNGIVARNSPVATFVEPVSSVAASVILQVLSTHARAHCVFLQSLEGELRGFELERQVIEFLAPSKKLLTATTLNSKPCPAVNAHADLALPLQSINEDLRSGALATLFVPLSKNFACDAITVPAINHIGTEAIVVWECSVTDPREASRVDKVKAWFDPDGIIAQIRSAFPGCSVVCALCFDGKLSAGKHTKFAELDKAAAAVTSGNRGASVTFAVISQVGLRLLGVKL